MKKPHNINTAMEIAYKSEQDIESIKDGGIVVGRAAADEDGNPLKDTYMSKGAIDDVIDYANERIVEYVDSQVPHVHVDYDEDTYRITFTERKGDGQTTVIKEIDLPLDNIMSAADVDNIWDGKVTAIASPPVRAIGETEHEYQQRLLAYENG